MTSLFTMIFWLSCFFCLSTSLAKPMYSDKRDSIRENCKTLVQQKQYSSLSSCIRTTVLERGKSTYIQKPKVKKIRFQPKNPIQLASAKKSALIFDLPITYNRKVQKWIQYFQNNNGRKWFTRWLERSHRYMPKIQKELKKNKLPLDLAYLAMIESGFSYRATSVADAVGPWQFIEATGKRFGLKISWWIDERRDFDKSTKAAIKYLKFLHQEFDSWYLVAAAYNTGEGRVRRLIRQHKTKNFWKISDRKGFVDETRNYIPKLLAAMLIAKAPSLYGFRNIRGQKPLKYEYYNAPGGTNLEKLADHIGVTRGSLKLLNPELIKNYIPKNIISHRIRIPKGAKKLVQNFVSQL